MVILVETVVRVVVVIAVAAAGVGGGHMMARDKTTSIL